MTDNEMLSLKKAIKEKYEEYRLSKPGKYPILKFNSYPAAYEHLRNSFKEELTKHGQADMQEALANVPSIKVFAKIFHEGYILRDDKMLDTCYLYAWGNPRSTVRQASQTTVVPPYTLPTASGQKTFVSPFLTNRMLVAGVALVVVLLACVLIAQPWAPPRAHGLVVYSPASGDTVPRVMLAEGKVTNASTVWIVIRPLGWLDYYVQTPIEVAKDGTWRPIHIGGANKAHIGIHSQLRAFVNPTKPLLENQLIHAWPDAELSSDTIEIVRGTQDVQVTTP